MIMACAVNKFDKKIMTPYLDTRLLNTMFVSYTRGSGLPHMRAVHLESSCF